MNIAEIKNLSFSFPDEDILLNDLNFSLEKGKIIALLGASGVGKTTLLKHFVYKRKPYGQSKGTILFEDQDLKTMDPIDQVSKIAYVPQDPEEQIISESVWQELAFSLENLAIDPDTMRLRIAEISNFFGIQNWFFKKTYELSGGQKQILNLATGLILKPDLLILDEADASLDPVMKKSFMDLIKRLNRELGLTVFFTSPNWDTALEIADQVLYLEGSELKEFTSARNFAKAYLSADKAYDFALASPTRAHFYLEPELATKDLALSVNAANSVISKSLREHDKKHLETLDYEKLDRHKEEDSIHDYVLEVKDLSFAYAKNTSDVLRNLNLKIKRNEIAFILGGNASGKSTLLKCLSGALDYQGKIYWNALSNQDKSFFKRKNEIKLAYLPQNARLLFSSESILEDINKALALLDEEEKTFVKELFDLEELSAYTLLERFGLKDKAHSFSADLSGGELQRAALILVLLNQPEVLLLDEPSNNLAVKDKLYLSRILKRLKDKGLSIIVVSHDLEFCAYTATECLLLFQGEIASQAEPHKFFNKNYFYTTDAARLFKNFRPDADKYSLITADELLKSLEKTGL